MKLDIQQHDNFAVITPGSKKLDSTFAPEFKSNLIVLGNALETGDLVINLEHVEFADSSGLSSLLLAHRLYRDSERSLVLCNLHARIHKLIEISQLLHSFTIVNTVQEAQDYLASLEEDSDTEEETD